MATITRLAKNFATKEASASSNQGSSDSPTPGDWGIGELMRQPAIASALRVLGDGSKERMALLTAMRPFVRDEKKEKLDRIIKTMKMLELLSGAQKLL
jgi:hypothetical protein